MAWGLIPLERSEFYWTELPETFFNFVIASPQNNGRQIDKGGEIRVDVAHPLHEYEAGSGPQACPLAARIPVSCERQEPSRLPGHRAAKAPDRGFRSRLLLARTQGLQDLPPAADQHRVLAGQGDAEPGTGSGSMAAAGSQGLVSCYRLGVRVGKSQI